MATRVYCSSDDRCTAYHGETCTAPVLALTPKKYPVGRYTLFMLMQGLYCSTRQRTRDKSSSMSNNSSTGSSTSNITGSSKSNIV